jgi:thiosulfate/3-mercaptopyruvate sulfurtransferase
MANGMKTVFSIMSVKCAASSVQWMLILYRRFPMKKIHSVCLLISSIFLLPLFASGRDIAPVVSTDWLEKNLSNPKIVMVDIRKVEEYKQGHIPNAINLFMGSWAMKKKGLDLELPENDDLFDLIGSAGIKDNTLVVVINKTDTDFDRVDATRVAWTIIYGGAENVAILDGGYNKWLQEKKPVSTEMVKPNAMVYKGKVNKAAGFVSKEYVLSKIGKSIIIDARAPDAYFGVSKAPYAERVGHIQGAVNLPSQWIFTKEGTVIGKEELSAMVAGIVGKDVSREIIIYCGVGGNTSGWWFMIKEVLGYKDVKFYDGSIQEWSKDPNAPMNRFSWQ